DETFVRTTATVACPVTFSGNFGRTSFLSAIAKSSAMVWPLSANHLSACAGLIDAKKRGPGVFIFGSARLIDGCKRASDARSHGISEFFGLPMVAIPMAP